MQKGGKMGKRTVREAIKYLASLDQDRATAQNGVGFNKFDSGIGHYLANKKYWSPDDLEIAKRLVQKYKKQLGFSTAEEVLNALDTSYKANNVIDNRKRNYGQWDIFYTSLWRIRLFPTYIEFNFHYDPEAVYTVKLLSGREFNLETKTWIVPLFNKATVINVIKFINSFANAREFEDIIQKLEKYIIDYPFTYRIEGNTGTVFIEYPTPVNKYAFPELKEIAFITDNKLIIEIAKLDSLKLKVLRQVLPEKVFSKVINKVFDYINEFEKSTQAVADEETEKFIQNLNLKVNLFNYQKVGVKRGYELIKKYNKVLITDEMGLGKTFQAIGIVKALEQNGDNPYPVLIIAPKSILYSWREEIGKIFGEEEKEKVIVLSGSPKRATEYQKILKEGKDLTDFRWIVINYQSVIKWKDIFKETPIATVILDEFHYIKNPKAQITKTVKEILTDKKIIALSGTPFLNRVWELRDVLETLGILPLLNLTKKKFNEKFILFEEIKISTKNGETRKVYKPKAGINLESLNLMLRSVMIRREKKDVLTELPPKIRNEVWIKLIGKDEEKYKISEDKFYSVLKEYEEKAEKEGLNVFDYIFVKQDPVLLRLTNELFFTLSRLKYKYVFEYVKELAETLNENEKFVVFAYTKNAQNGLYELFKEHGFNPLRINAEMKQKERANAVKQFQENDENKVIVVSLGAGAEGITLTRAKNLIFADLWYQPQKLLQAEDRIHRVGQNDVANIHYILAKNTIDERVWNKIIKPKLEEFNLAIRNEQLLDKVNNIKKSLS
jgi:SWI/SNF-related matrix-associated actin-dependent regulator 1 of chromatin subfamily A